jgi:hypothetical protein
MGSFIDLVGLKFGRLLVVDKTGKEKDGNIKWLCKCDCGKTSTVRGATLRRGTTNSCGCLQMEVARANVKHGHLVGYRHSPEYTTWRAMLRRCNDEKHVDYRMYGGRGIKVCDHWLEFESFLADVGTRPEGKSLDRIDSNKGYSPDNVRWSTPKEQARNMKSNRLITLNGETKCVSEWADVTGIPQNTIRTRLFNGWGDVKAITTPVRQKTV